MPKIFPWNRCVLSNGPLENLTLPVYIVNLAWDKGKSKREEKMSHSQDKYKNKAAKT
jgi:hypothetical protein